VVQKCILLHILSSTFSDDKQNLSGFTNGRNVRVNENCCVRYFVDDPLVSNLSPT